MTEICSLQDLRGVYEPANELAVKKELDHVDRHARDFIAASPFVVLSTSDADGWPDASPRGDAAGFVKVVGEKRLHLPDRPGNNRLDTLENIMRNPRVGLLFLVPGRLETLRVNGRARLLTDQVKSVDKATVEQRLEVSYRDRLY
jgi:PPOX class probable FMN-dependent enzyme